MSRSTDGGLLNIDNTVELEPEWDTRLAALLRQVGVDALLLLPSEAAHAAAQTAAPDASFYEFRVPPSASGAVDEIVIYQVQTKRLGIGYQIWPAALFLCEYLRDHPGFLVEKGAVERVRDLRYLELGAGTGLAGLYLAALGADVVLTDLPSVLPGLRRNAELNTALPGRVEVRLLTWGSDDADEVRATVPYDVILLADCVYWESLYALLMDTLKRLLQGHAFVLLSQRHRFKREARFFQAAAKAFRVEKIHEHVVKDVDPQNGQLYRYVSRIYIFRPRGEGGQ